MTISDAVPHNPPPPTAFSNDAGGPLNLLDTASAISFSIGPDTPPSVAMEEAVAMVGMTLPRFLAGAPGAKVTCEAAQAILRELVDVTARHKASQDLVGRVTYDGAHVMVSVGDMDCRLPAPEEEPGLYLVHRVADDVGQYSGDMGGQVTWASVAA
ncbi:hypothetical protein [Streptomyces sp. NPDC047315]|uniref:hypothetical protein n=1 Tax=Streptomyces sp. NPDC047315 TaxID=3155142 RepID=UPI0033C7945F